MHHTHHISRSPQRFALALSTALLTLYIGATATARPAIQIETKAANRLASRAASNSKRSASGSVPTPQRPFFIGYNEAWFGGDYGFDLTSKFNPQTVNETFDGIKASGGSVVRLWLFELREGFLLRQRGSNQASRAEIKGLDPAFLKNLETVIAIAKARGLKLYLTFLSGGEMTDDEANPRANFYRNLLNNRNGELDAYHDLVLKPVLRLLNQHSETIFAVDLINEIEGPIQNFYWLTGWFGAREWIATEVNFIKRISPRLKITVTAGYSFPAEEITLGLFSGLGLDFYDLHIYSDSGMYDGVTALCERSAADGVPVILGEFGQKAEIDDDALQAKATYNFLKIARENCFAGALAWRYDKAEKWWRYIRPDGSPRPAVEVMKMFSK